MNMLSNKTSKNDVKAYVTITGNKHELTYGSVLTDQQIIDRVKRLCDNPMPGDCIKVRNTTHDLFTNKTTTNEVPTSSAVASDVR